MHSMPTERHTVNIRLDPALVRALDDVATQAPVLSRHAICRAALHVGLAAISEDLTILLRPLPGSEPPKKRSKRAAK
jgi:hypothetical protein